MGILNPIENAFRKDGWEYDEGIGAWKKRHATGVTYAKVRGFTDVNMGSEDVNPDIVCAAFAYPHDELLWDDYLVPTPR